MKLPPSVKAVGLMERPERFASSAMGRRAYYSRAADAVSTFIDRAAAANTLGTTSRAICITTKAAQEFGTIMTNIPNQNHCGPSITIFHCPPLFDDWSIS